MTGAKLQREPKTRQHLLRRFLLRLLVLVLIVAAVWFLWLYRQIHFAAGVDNAQRADAIAVFGAAEYGGKPSPVLHARLDKALLLYQTDLAPTIVTLGGGSAEDGGNTEGAAGRDYLLANGVPNDRIIAETTSVDTEEQVERLVSIAHENGFRSVDVVSDGTHLYRIALLCHQAGLRVYTSPRAVVGNIDLADRAQRMMHELLSTTSVALHLHASAMRRWAAGRED